MGTGTFSADPPLFLYGGVCRGRAGDQKLVEESCANNGWWMPGLAVSGS